MIPVGGGCRGAWRAELGEGPQAHLAGPEGGPWGEGQPRVGDWSVGSASWAWGAKTSLVHSNPSQYLFIVFGEIL